MAEAMSDERLADIRAQVSDGAEAANIREQWAWGIAAELLTEVDRLRALDDENVGSEKRPLTKRELHRIGMAVVGPLKYMPERWDHETVVKLYWALMQQRGETILAQKELVELRDERTAADDAAPYRRWLTRNLGAAYAAGWEAHADLVTGTLATLSHDKREQCSRAWTAQRLDDLTEDDQVEQQREDGDRG